MGHLLFLLLFLCLENRLCPKAQALSRDVGAPYGVRSLYRGPSLLDWGDKHPNSGPFALLPALTATPKWHRCPPFSSVPLFRLMRKSDCFLSRRNSTDHCSPACLTLRVPWSPSCPAGSSLNTLSFLTLSPTGGPVPIPRRHSKLPSAAPRVREGPSFCSFRVSFPRSYPLPSSPRFLFSVTAPPTASTETPPLLSLISAPSYEPAGSKKRGTHASATQGDVPPVDVESLSSSEIRPQSCATAASCFTGSAPPPSSLCASTDIPSPFPFSSPSSDPSPSYLPPLGPPSASPFTSPSSPLPTPAMPLPAPDLSSGLSPAGRPLDVDPHGPLAQLQQLLREGIFKAGAYLQHWPLDEERDMDMLVTKIDETAAISPGQKTVIQLPVHERERVVRNMRATRSATVLLGYVDYKDEGDLMLPSTGSIAQGSRSAVMTRENSPKAEGRDDYMLVGYGAVAEPMEIHMLDRSGEMGLRIMGRVKIVSVLEASETNFRVRVIPHRDERKRDGFVNPLVSRENIKALYSLYDRVNRAELHFRKLEGKMHQAHLISLRPPLQDKVDEFINETSGFSEQDIGEWVSFCAMDHHIDARARCWAMAQQDTELRLDVVRRSLEDKLRRLQTEIQRLKDKPAARSLDDAAQPVTTEPPLNIKI